MSVKGILILGISALALVGILSAVGCGSTEPKPAVGPGEKAGAALDRVLEKSGAEANKAVEKTGEVLKKIGTELEKKGEELQDRQPAPTKP